MARCLVLPLHCRCAGRVVLKVSIDLAGMENLTSRFGKWNIVRFNVFFNRNFEHIIKCINNVSRLPLLFDITSCGCFIQ